MRFPTGRALDAACTADQYDRVTPTRGSAPPFARGSPAKARPRRFGRARFALCPRRESSTRGRKSPNTTTWRPHRSRARAYSTHGTRSVSFVARRATAGRARRDAGTSAARALANPSAIREARAAAAARAARSASSAATRRALRRSASVARDDDDAAASRRNTVDDAFGEESRRRRGARVGGPGVGEGVEVRAEGEVGGVGFGALDAAHLRAGGFERLR